MSRSIVRRKRAQTKAPDRIAAQMWQSIGLGLALGSSLLLAGGCGDTTGDVSGTLFFATASGQAKRGADVEVILVPGTTAHLDKDLAALQGRMARELEPIKEDSGASEPVTRKYRDEALSLLRRHNARTTRTDVNGGYVFKDLPSGRALVLAEWSTPELVGSSWMESNYVWFLPVEVKRGENRLDLSGSSARGAFCPRRWEPGGPCK